MTLGERLRKLWVAARLRCPNCEQGRMFTGFNLHATCPVCHVAFERREGESTGGMMINLVIVETSAVAGFFLIEILTDIPPTTQLWFWMPYSLLMPLLLYRSSRALWIGMAYLNGDVYAADSKNNPPDNPKPH